MTATNIHPQYSPGEELANIITGGLGLLLSVAGFVVLVTLAAVYADAWAVTASAIYGTTLVLGYASSTIYHAVKNPRRKHVLRKVDHAAIFTLIAGTYTPFMLVNLRGPWGWTFFGIVWGLALAGIIMKFWFTGRFIKLSTAIYIAMGWLIVIAAKPMISGVPAVSLWLLLAGGLCYTGGALFYIQKKLRFHHAIWHGFILAGSITHYLAILYAMV
ncbi:hemolysin III [Ereboglobus sp. PH5-5]|uniref:PAQR family membrane homeostasis protein TrhA n=1 Tax=unclassified Ereboglobus TaxID=2626932 RepID=UPI002405C638|nr:MULTISPECIES: hemolysin III family protein [unclassified Ereboglobus]MDF9827979.1 hemolysin III [Ereboglobus sp. PH5-10]MDF9832377.1 hemolysin III [Ereboglobus sp. PH5-5]